MEKQLLLVTLFQNSLCLLLNLLPLEPGILPVKIKQVILLVDLMLQSMENNLHNGSMFTKTKLQLILQIMDIMLL